MRGLPEAKRLLDEFQGRALDKRVKNGLRAGAKRLRPPLRAAGAQRSQRVGKSVGYRTKGHNVIVGPRFFTWLFFERGTKPHGIPIGRGPSAGRVIPHPGQRPTPFVGPTFDAQRSGVERDIEAKMFEGLR